jgi:hypothetical protein
MDDVCNEFIEKGDFEQNYIKRLCFTITGVLIPRGDQERKVLQPKPHERGNATLLLDLYLGNMGHESR